MQRAHTVFFWESPGFKQVGRWSILCLLLLLLSTAVGSRLTDFSGDDPVSLYFVSSMLQGFAALFGIVVTGALVFVQLAANTYGYEVSPWLLLRDRKLPVAVFSYVATVILSACTLGLRLSGGPLRVAGGATLFFGLGALVLTVLVLSRLVMGISPWALVQELVTAIPKRTNLSFYDYRRESQGAVLHEISLLSKLLRHQFRYGTDWLVTWEVFTQCLLWTIMMDSPLPNRQKAATHLVLAFDSLSDLIPEHRKKAVKSLIWKMTQTQSRTLRLLDEKERVAWATDPEVAVFIFFSLCSSQEEFVSAAVQELLADSSKGPGRLGLLERAFLVFFLYQYAGTSRLEEVLEVTLPSVTDGAYLARLAGVPIEVMRNVVESLAPQRCRELFQVT